MKYSDGIVTGVVLGAGAMSMWHGSWFMGRLDSPVPLYFGAAFLAFDIIRGCWK